MTDKDFPNVAIVILNWNCWEETIECLESVFQLDYPNYSVIVVDNDSEDDSVEKINEYAEGKIIPDSEIIEYEAKNKPINVIEKSEDELDGKYLDFNNDNSFLVIKNKDNYGYAGGNNVALRYILDNNLSEYSLILNPDAVVEKKLLKKLTPLIMNNKIGIVGPLMYRYSSYNQKIAQYAGGDLNMWTLEEKIYGRFVKDGGQFNKKFVDKVTGSCMLVDNKMLVNIGLFDEQYFLLWEDMDLCQRARQAGYKILFNPQAKFWHRGAFKLVGEKRTYYSIRNRFLFMKKHSSFMLGHISLLYFFIFKFWFFLGGILLHKKYEVVKSYLKGIRDGLILYNE